MQFVYPQMLWALAALAVPVIVHLFNFQRPRRVLFTNVRFLRQVKSATRATARLKHLLILAARIGFVAALVLAFAQPVLRPAGGVVEEPERVSFYLDNSFSMQQRDGERTALDRGVTMVTALLEALPEGASAQLLTNEFTGAAQYFYGRERLLDEVAAVSYASAYRSLPDVYARQRAAGPAAELFWFTDFQRSTMGDLSLLQLDTNQVLNVVPLQQPSVRNVYVDSVWLSNPFLQPTPNNTLRARVANAGNAAVSNLTLRLFLDSLQVSTATVSVGADATAEASFTFATPPAGTSRRGRLSFEDYPVTFDNDYYFVLDQARRVAIAHIYDQLTPYVPGAFDNAALFEFESFSYRSADFDFLRRADLIILDGLAAPTEGLTDAVEQRYAAGASVAVFPAARPDAERYAALLARLGGPPLQPVAAPPPATDASHQLAPPDPDNSFYAGVFEDARPRNLLMPYGHATVRWRGGQPLLSLKTGQPFLSEFPGGEGGRLYLSAAPLGDPYTNLPKHALFVPIMYRMALRAAGAAEQLAYSFQEPVVSLRLGQKSTDEVYRLRQDDFETIPAQRRVGRTLVLEVPRADLRAGYYDLRLAGETVRTLAFNYGAAESRVGLLPAAELREALAAYPNVRVYENPQVTQLVGQYRAASVGTPLWKYALGAALIFLLIETLLIRFWKS